MDNRELSVVLHEIDLVLHHEIDKELKKIALSAEQSRIIMLLKESDVLCQNEIALKLDKNKATVARMLDSIEKKGFVKKEKDPENWKQNNISLTKKGRAAFDTIFDCFVNVNKKIDAHVTDEEKETLVSIIDKIKKGIVNP